MFLANSGVDETAANDLRGCPPHVIKLVIQQGTLEGTKNPSGALIGRIKRARLEAEKVLGKGAGGSKENPGQGGSGGEAGAAALIGALLPAMMGGGGKGGKAGGSGA